MSKMALRSLAVLSFIHISMVYGISDSGLQVFEYAHPGTPALPGIELLDQTGQGAHSILRRDIVDPAVTTVAPPIVIQDNHMYYNKTVAINHPLSSFYSKEFDRIFANYTTRSHGQLNHGKNIALEIPLSFPFDFYGHPIQTVAVTTGGFLYANEMTHPYLAYSQYIAPLMADFETKRGVSSIKYVEIEGAFWVRWENLLVSRTKAGNFSFQCAIFANGSIVFDYISIPMSMAQLKAASPTILKVGLSDAFYLDIRTSQYGTVARKIVKYSELAVVLDKVVTDGVIMFTHLPTCNQQKSCQDCNNRTRVPGFNCSWCYELNRCSSGVDREVQEWHDSDCPYLPGGDCSGRASSRQKQQAGSAAAAGRAILGICIGCLVLALLCLVVGVLIHGYKHPDSRLGAWLIEHRPSRIREHLFRGGRGGAPGDSYKVGGDSPYVSFTNA